MIHDIYPRIFDNRFTPRPPKDCDIVFGYDGDKVLLNTDHTFFQYRQLPHSLPFTYLFSIDETAFYLSDLSMINSISENINFTRTYHPKYLAYACVTGWQLYQWQKTSRYCGACGTKTIPDQTERAMRCPNCGNLIYPRINPAVIVGIISPDHRLLVTQYSLQHGSYRHDALVAGYAEIGETIEDCVRREVKEETGLAVGNLTYYKSQPWSYSGSLLFGFFCRSDSTDITLDRSELRSAVWKAADDFFDVPGNNSLTAEMISVFQKGKLPAFSSN